MKNKFILAILVFILSACSPAPKLIKTPTVSPTRTTKPAFSQTPTASSTTTTSPSRTSTSTSTPTATQTSTPTATFTPIPTYSVLRGEVIPAHVNCYYGPGKAYLYKYGLVGGSNLEIIGRNVDTGYLKVQAIGGDNPCWMNSEWMNIKGELELIEPIPPEDVILPLSPYYGPPSGQQADRSGDEVTITWNWFGLRAGDSSEQYPYLIEAWVCQNGEFRFIPLGAWVNTLTITDEAGCEQTSHARLFAVEKHGYPPSVEIPWPPHPDNQP